MTYYKQDAQVMMEFEGRIRELEPPFQILRKFNGIMNAIHMNIEDEYAYPKVVEPLFDAFEQLAREVAEPKRGILIELAAQYRKEIIGRVQRRSPGKKP